jgi:hypothetical protein
MMIQRKAPIGRGPFSKFFFIADGRIERIVVASRNTETEATRGETAQKGR